MGYEVQNSLLAINLGFFFKWDSSRDDKNFSSVCRNENLAAIIMAICRVQIGILFFRSNCDGALQTEIFCWKHCNFCVLIINKQKISAFCKTHTLELWHLILVDWCNKLFLFFFHKFTYRLYTICSSFFRLLKLFFLFFLLRLPLFSLLDFIQSNFNYFDFCFDRINIILYLLIPLFPHILFTLYLFLYQSECAFVRFTLLIDLSFNIIYSLSYQFTLCLKVFHNLLLSTLNLLKNFFSLLAIIFEIWCHCFSNHLCNLTLYFFCLLNLVTL